MDVKGSGHELVYLINVHLIWKISGTTFYDSQYDPKGVQHWL